MKVATDTVHARMALNIVTLHFTKTSYKDEDAGVHVVDFADVTHMKMLTSSVPLAYFPVPELLMLFMHSILSLKGMSHGKIMGQFI